MQPAPCDGPGPLCSGAWRCLGRRCAGPAAPRRSGCWPVGGSAAQRWARRAPRRPWPGATLDVEPHKLTEPAMWPALNLKKRQSSSRYQPRAPADLWQCPQTFRTMASSSTPSVPGPCYSVQEAKGRAEAFKELHDPGFMCGNQNLL